MSLVEHAKTEFRAAGWCDEDGKFNDEMQHFMCDQVIELLTIFGEHGHSGSTAPYALNLFTRLANFKPIAPLTGEDWEWSDVSDFGGDPRYQNKRCSRVFKNKDGQAYDIDGKVFWEWCRRPLDEGEEGYPGFKDYKSYFTSRDSRVPVTFPYHVPDKPIYEYRYSADCDPPAPPQTEEGIL